LSLSRKHIEKNVSTKAKLSLKESKLFLSQFLNLIKSKRNHNIKLSNFGVFYTHKTIERVGRNPKNNKEYVIPSSLKLNFRTSNKVRKVLN
jgi:nucleoid DNA-binding protein